ncbi:LysR family transcriptional regulator [Enterococcus sp. BWM-S5]|uniref:LysR family transcriptional regulator n=1 Tax=Enterococcus larvae TaxID=2794352 RepID=A0ABS4CLM2_9ENTE|nr:LysR family transcriptional regulator [Enterococcus larvae]
MLLNQMKYFVAVVEHNSFTEAAAASFISQSAISQQIQSLEEELGVELLHRKHRSFQMTPAGEHFYRQSKLLLADITKLKRETIQIGESKESQLKIGYLRVYGGLELHEAVAVFSERYPEISLSIINGTHEELYHELRQKSVDIVLSDQRRAFSEDYMNVELVRSEMYAELSIRNPLSRQTELTLTELKDIPCILIATKEQQAIEEDYYKHTLGFRGNFLFAESLDEGRLLVAGNRGFLPIESVGTLPQPVGTIRRIPLVKDQAAITRKYCAFWQKKRSNYYIEEFAELLKELLIKE